MGKTGNKVNLKIHGVRRTGTNYFKRLMDKNFKNIYFLESEGWKHGIANDNEKIDGHIILVKNIYAWINSIRKHKRLINEPYEVTKIFVENYFIKYGHWITTLKQKSIIINYEDLIIEEKRQRIMNHLSKKFNLEKNEKDENIEKIVSPQGVKNKKFDVNYYLDKEYLKDLSSLDIKNINKSIKEFEFEKIYRKLGYSLIKRGGRNTEDKVKDKIKEILFNLKRIINKKTVKTNY